MSEPRGVEGHRVGIGVVVGFLADPLVTTLLASAFGPGDSAWWLLTFLVLPVACLPFLVWPRSRQLGAGLLIGVALGAVVFAGSCIGLLALFGGLAG